MTAPRDALAAHLTSIAARVLNEHTGWAMTGPDDDNRFELVCFDCGEHIGDCEKIQDEWERATGRDTTAGIKRGASPLNQAYAAHQAAVVVDAILNAADGQPWRQELFGGGESVYVGVSLEGASAMTDTAAPICSPGSGYPVPLCKALDLCDCFDWPEYDREVADESARLIARALREEPTNDAG